MSYGAWIHANAFPRETMNSSAKAPAPSAQAAMASPPTRMDTLIALSVDTGRNHRAMGKLLDDLEKVVHLARDSLERNTRSPVIGMIEVLTYSVPRARVILTQLLESEPSYLQR